MQHQYFRDRVVDAAERVETRTGVDPLDLDRSTAATTDARLELLPGSIGIGLGAMAIAAALACIGFIVTPGGSPGTPLTALFVIVSIALGLACAATVLVSRAARGRRPARDRYEDAWAKLAVEIWPPPRYQSWDGGAASGASYSRTEFLVAVRDGRALDEFERRAPLTRMP